MRLGKAFGSGQKVLTALAAALAISSCNAKPPKWHGKIWAGDSRTQTIQRGQDAEEIACFDPRFDGYMCISYADFKTFYDTFVLGCRSWRKDLPRMNAEQAWEAYQDSGAARAVSRAERGR